MEKPFLTISQQIELLKKRGLTFKNEDKAYKSLERYGYYQIINGHKSFLLKEKLTEDDDDCFINDATFEHIYAVHQFDKALRNHVIQSTLEIESILRTAIGYTIAELYGDQEANYLNRINYRPGEKKYNTKLKKNEYKIDQLLRKFKKINNDKIHPFKHYKEKYNNVPPWIMLNGATFGNLLTLFKLLKPTAKNKVLASISELTPEFFEKKENEDYKNLYTDILFLCLAFRNRAAHGGRIYNYKPSKSIIRYNYSFHNSINITPADYRADKGKSDIYTLLNCLYYFDNYGDLSLDFGINWELKRHLQEYPLDKDRLYLEMGLPGTFEPTTKS